MKVNAVILDLYLTLVWIAFIFVKVTDNAAVLAVLFVLFAVAFYFLSALLLKLADRIRVKAPSELSFKSKALAFSCGTAVTLLVCLLWFAAFFPGAYSGDSLYQYMQAAYGGMYNDWHPVWHTFLIFTLPLKIFGKAFTVVLLQLVYFSLALGFAGLVIYKHAGLKSAMVSFAYVLLNPYVFCVLMYPWKDAACTVAATVVLAMAVDIWFDREKANGWLRMFFLGGMLANVTIFRHNAILFSGMLIIALFFILPKKQWLKMMLAFAGLMFLVRVPFYRYLHVEKPGDRVIETTGLPLTVIGNVAAKSPELMDSELSEFVYSMADGETWSSVYVCGNFNSIKSSDRIDLEVVEQAGAGTVLKMMLKCFKCAPKASFEGAIALTDMVYGLGVGIEGDVEPSIFANGFGIEYAGNESLAAFLLGYKNVIYRTPFIYLFTLGFSIFVILTVMLSKAKLNVWSDWKRIIMGLSVLAYDFGTALLLTGPDSRFFLLNYTLCPLVVALFIGIKGEKANE